MVQTLRSQEKVCRCAIAASLHMDDVHVAARPFPVRSRRVNRNNNISVSTPDPVNRNQSAGIIVQQQEEECEWLPTTCCDLVRDSPNFQPPLYYLLGWVKFDGASLRLRCTYILLLQEAFRKGGGGGGGMLIWSPVGGKFVVSPARSGTAVDRLIDPCRHRR